MTQKELFDRLSKGARWDIGVSINRSNALPIDANSVFSSKEELDRYASGSPSQGTLNNAYPGQIVAVVNSDSTVVYYIDQDMKAQEVGIRLEGDNSTIEIVDNKILLKGFLPAPNNTLLFKNDVGELTWSDITSLVPINGVKEDDKLLSLEDSKLKSTLSLEYNSTDNKIKLIGNNDTVISEIDASNFLIDSIIEDVEYDATDNTLIFKWSTSSGIKEEKVTLTNIMDPYQAGAGIQIDGTTVKIKISPNSEDYIKVTTDGIVVSGINSKFEDHNQRLGALEDVDLQSTIDSALEEYSTTEEMNQSINSYFRIEEGYRIIDGGRLT